MNILCAVLSILAGLVTALLLHAQEEAAAHTPRAEATHDERKVNDALAAGDISDVNAAFDALRGPLDAAAGIDTAVGHGDQKKSG